MRWTFIVGIASFVGSQVYPRQGLLSLQGFVVYMWKGLNLFESIPNSEFIRLLNESV